MHENGFNRVNPTKPYFDDRKNRCTSYISACYNLSNLPPSRKSTQANFYFLAQLVLKVRGNSFNQVSLCRAWYCLTGLGESIL